MASRSAELVSLTPQCGIAVMAKASAPGRTKTRLVPPLSFDEAAALNTAFLSDIAATVVAAAQRASIGGAFAYGPAGASAFFESIVPSGFVLIEACQPDFSDCLFETIEALFARGHDLAVVVNADSPTLPIGLLVEAVEALAAPGERAVLGPAADGGYYLLGLKQAHRHMFEAIDWSTERVASQTLERARAIGVPVHVLPQWYDVDDVAALRTLFAELFEGYSFNLPLAPNRPAHTAALLESLRSDADFTSRLGMDTAALLKRVGT